MHHSRNITNKKALKGDANLITKSSTAVRASVPSAAYPLRVAFFFADTDFGPHLKNNFTGFYIANYKRYTISVDELLPVSTV